MVLRLPLCPVCHARPVQVMFTQFDGACLTCAGLEIDHETEGDDNDD